MLLAILAAAVPVRGQAPEGDGDPVLIKVNGTPVRRSDVLARLWKTYGRETLHEMVDELILKQAAQARGIKPKPEELAKRLERVTSRYPNEEAFLAHLAENGATVDSLKADIAHDVVRENLLVELAAAKATDAELRQAFAKRRKELTMPEAVHLRHIVVKTESQASEIVAKVKEGAPFKDLAREHSLAASGKAAGGDYGFVFRGMLPKELEAAAFAMKENEIRVLAGPNSRHVLQVLAKRAAQPLEFDQAKETLQEYVLSEKVGRALPKIMTDLRAKAEIKLPEGMEKK